MVRKIAAAILLAAGLSGCQAPTSKTQSDGVQGAARALEALGALPQGVETAAHAAAARSSDADTAAARDVLSRIDSYAEGARVGAPAVHAWFALYDDYRKLTRAQAGAIDDPRIGQSLSTLSLVAVLPGPVDWPALRDEARGRTTRAGNAEVRTDAIALVLLFDALLYDVPAQTKSLEQLRDAAAKTSAERRTHTLALTDEWRKYLQHDAGRFDANTRPERERRASAACCKPNAPRVEESKSGEDIAAIAARLQEQLSQPVAQGVAKSSNDPRLMRATPALQLAELGLLEKRDDWLHGGLNVAQDMLAQTRVAVYSASDDYESFERARVLTDTVRVMRSAGLTGSVEKLLFEELAAIGATCRTLTAKQCHDRFVNPYSGRDDDLAAKLLLALYAGLGRDADARTLADRYPLWMHDDAASLSVDLGFSDTEQPAIAIASALVAAGETQRAATVLQTMSGQPDRINPQVARMYGQVAKDEAVGVVLLMRQHALGPRNAIAAVAAAAAGLWPRAEELALAARREQLYRPWRAAMDDVLAGAADVNGDAAAVARWRDAAQAQLLATRAARYQKVGIVSKAADDYAAALEKAQPGDCIDNDALAAARTRKDTAQVSSLLERLARNAQRDPTGGAIGCLKAYLSLTPEEFSVLRPALLAGMPDNATPQFVNELPYLLYTLDVDCNLSVDAFVGRTCVEPAQLVSDARAAYASVKDHLLPYDIDGVETLDAMVRRSAFASLYAGHLDRTPEPPAVEVSAYERDDWPLRLAKFDPTTLPKGIERRNASGTSYWSPVVHLADYWAFAYGAFSRQPPPEALGAAYPLAATSAYAACADASSTAQCTAPRAKYVPPREPSLRANLVVASTEIVMTAVRLLEPGRHDPCTTCL